MNKTNYEIQVQVEKEGIHKVRQKVEGRERPQGNRKRLPKDDQVLQSHPCDCPHSGMSRIEFLVLLLVK
jgi:hypothetical protein